MTAQATLTINAEVAPTHVIVVTTYLDNGVEVGQTYTIGEHTLAAILRENVKR